MESTSPRLVEIYRASNPAEAHTLRIALEQAGITAEIAGEVLQSVWGGLPVGWATAPRIVVHESNATAARAIIESQQRAALDCEGSERDCCLACGQAMGDVATCPSCGWSYQDSEEA